jgi:hypothetical protein
MVEDVSRRKFFRRMRGVAALPLVAVLPNVPVVAPLEQPATQVTEARASVTCTLSLAAYDGPYCEVSVWE